MQTIKQILIIVLASIIVMALFMPLAYTDWADGMRSGVGQETEGMEREGRQGPGEMPAGVGFILGFVKEILIMLISGVITLGVLRLIKGDSHRRKTEPM